MWNLDWVHCFFAQMHEEDLGFRLALGSEHHEVFSSILTLVLHLFKFANYLIFNKLPILNYLTRILTSCPPSKFITHHLIKKTHILLLWIANVTLRVIKIWTPFSSIEKAEKLRLLQDAREYSQKISPKHLSAKLEPKNMLKKILLSMKFTKL